MRTESIARSVDPPLVFERPSRSGDAPHQVSVDAVSLRPFHCTCRAGQRDIVCWAALQDAVDDLLPIARQRWLDARGMAELECAAAVYGQVLRRRAAAARVLAERAQRDANACPMPDPDAPIPYVLTDQARAELGAAVLHEARAS
jgi:hypothetical protein